MADKPFVVKTHDVHMDSEYREWIAELKQRYQTSQIKAAVKVNSEQLLFNWQLGRDLVIRRAEENGARAWSNRSASICRQRFREQRDLAHRISGI